VRVLETGNYDEIETFERDNLKFLSPPILDFERHRVYLLSTEPARVYVVDLPAGDCDYPSQNLQHLWAGDGTYKDRTTRELVPNGAVSFAPGLVGRCFRLDHARLSFETPYNSLSHLTIREGTLQAWIKTQDVSRGSSLFELTVDGRPAWRIGLEILPTAGTWHHIAVIVRAGKLTVFVDGTPVIKERSLYSPSVYQKMRLTIGALNGFVDEVAIHDRAFGSGEILNSASRVQTCVSGPKN
jgi:hypothetical protein